MVKITASPLVTSLSGSIGGMTFREHQGVQVGRRRVTPAQPGGDSVEATRQRFRDLSSTYLGNRGTELVGWGWENGAQVRVGTARNLFMGENLMLLDEDGGWANFVPFGWPSSRIRGTIEKGCGSSKEGDINGFVNLADLRIPGGYDKLGFTISLKYVGLEIGYREERPWRTYYTPWVNDDYFEWSDTGLKGGQWQYAVIAAAVEAGEKADRWNTIVSDWVQAICEVQ